MQNYIFTLLLLTLSSAFCSASETAFSCTNKIRIKNLANNDNAQAKKVLKLLEKYDEMITTILIFNNIVNIASATIATLLFTSVYGDLGATISTVVMTVVILIFGEITPKSLAKESPEKFAMWSSDMVSFLIVVFKPISLLFSGWRWMIIKVLKIQNTDSVTQDELLTMVEEAENDGDLESHESDLICAAIEFNDLDVKDILTPRVDLVAIDVKTELEDIEKAFRLHSYSRLPVYENTIDNIVGFIHEKDFYYLYYKDKGPIKSIIKNCIYTGTHVKISSILKQLQGGKTHMAVVLDEYGGTAGIITLEDILEELVGDIWDEHDIVKEYYKQVSDNEFLVEGDTELDDMFDRFNVKYDDFDFITVSGWVMHEFECIPKVGESFVFNNLYVEVTKVTSRKVLEVRVVINEVEAVESEKKKG